MTRKTIYLIAGLLLCLHGQAQSLIVDRVVGVVGDFTVLQSDIEQQYLQMAATGASLPADVRCLIFNHFVEQKLLMAQAKIDSVEVSASMVELQMEARLNYFLSQFGSEEEMQEYFSKSMFDIRADLRDLIREQMITEEVRQSIIADVSTTPSDVKSFFRSIHPDSVPYINTQVKIAQIVAYPAYSEEAIFEVKDRLLELRERVLEGEDFGTLAVLYSEAPEAARRGEIGFMQKNELDRAYANEAWTLRPGQVSKIVESSFGFHLIQMIERRGDRANTRHILMNPKADANARQKAIQKLDSLRNQIEMDSLTVDQAAKMFSEDRKTGVNGGLIVNPQTMAATFELDQLSTQDYYVIRNMEVGDLSEPYETTDDNGKTCYKLIYLKSRTEPHRANLRQDYLLLQNMALEQKYNEVMEEWYGEKKATTYIRVDPSFSGCALSGLETSQR